MWKGQALYAPVMDTGPIHGAFSLDLSTLASNRHIGLKHVNIETYV